MSSIRLERFMQELAAANLGLDALTMAAIADIAARSLDVGVDGNPSPAAAGIDRNNETQTAKEVVPDNNGIGGIVFANATRNNPVEEESSALARSLLVTAYTVTSGENTN